MKREDRANPLNRLPAAVVVRNKISRLDDERRKLEKLLELCLEVETAPTITCVPGTSKDAVESQRNSHKK